MFAHIINNDTELRILEPRHSAELFELVDENREHLSPWFPWTDTTTSPLDIEEFIKEQLRRYADTGGFAAGIWYKGEIAGSVALYVNVRDVHGEIAYWLGCGFQGKGLVTESCKSVLQHAFTELELNRVQIRTATDNVRSRAVAERLGFKYEGTLRSIAVPRDVPIDLDYHSLLKDEWNSRK